MSEVNLSEFKTAADELKNTFAQMDEAAKVRSEEIKTLGDTTAENKEKLEKMTTDFGEKLDKYNSEVKRMKAELEARGNASNGRRKQDTYADRVLKGLGLHDKDGKYVDGSHKSISLGKSYSINGTFLSKAFTPDLVSDDAGGSGQIVDLTRDPNVYVEPHRILSMRNLIPNIPISGGTLEIQRQAYFGEVDSSSGATGTFGNAGLQTPQLSAKNKSQINYELKQYSPYTSAGFLVVSRQALQDTQGIRNRINTELVYSVDRDLNNQILNGSGVSGELEGLNTIARDFVPRDPQPTIEDTAIDAIRVAMGQLMTDSNGIGQYMPEAVVLNHFDWTNIETQKDEDGRYIYGNPAGILSPRIWGIPVVPQNDQPAGTFLVGAFSLGSQLRPVIGSAEVRFTDSHEDLFIKNGIVMLAEERVILANQLPNAYVSGEFPEGSE